MSPDLALYAALQTVTADVWAFPAPSTAPALRTTYQRVAGSEHATLNSGTGAPRARFQIDVWGPSKGQVRTLADQFKAALPGILKVGELADNPDDYETDTKLHRASFDVVMWT